MASSIFKSLAFLETEIADGSVTGKRRAVISAVIDLVESGRFTDSDVEKYICRRFRETSSAIAREWNDAHPARRKSADTFRCQVSSVNRYLVSLLGLNGDELTDAVFTGKAAVIDRLADLISAFDSEGDGMAGRFEMAGDDDRQPGGSYPVDECRNEIAFLKTIDRRRLDELMACVDRDKLSYVLRVLRQPLVRDVYVNVDGRKRKIKTAEVAYHKIDLMKALEAAEPMAQAPKFDLEMPKRFEAILLSCLRSYDLRDEERKLVSQARSTETSREAARDLLSVFTVDGFKEHIRKLNAYDLVSELREHLKE